MEPRRYYQYLNSVTHFETAGDDARALLTRIGTRKEYGETGWGVNGTAAIFSGKPKRKYWLRKHYNFRLERVVDSIYESDYSRAVLDLRKRKLFNETKVVPPTGEARSEDHESSIQ